MKILLVSPLPPPAGGIATWTEAYCKYCEDAGHFVRLINTAVVGKRVSQQHKKSIKDELIRNCRIVMNMRKSLRRERFDGVHINTSCSKPGLLRDVLCMLLATGQNVILHCHCNIEDQIGSSALGRKLLKFAISRAKKVIVLNKKSRDFLNAMGCGNVQIVPNFIETDAVVKEHFIRENIERIIFVGHVRRSKGFFEILEAAEQLPEFTFQIVGPVCEDLASIQVPANVQMLGKKTKNEVMKLLQKADVFLFPSYTEGFSIALLEAMASGLPIIATDVGANADMIETLGGVLVPVMQSTPIADAIDALSTDMDQRKRMSDWNIEKVRRHYSSREVIELLLYLYEEL